MALHRISSFVLQVPNVDEVVSYYEEFGLTNNGDHTFSTTDGGRQLTIEEGPFRRITTFTVGADDPDDLGRIAANLRRLGVAHTLAGDRLESADPATGTRIAVTVESRVDQPAHPQPQYNVPGNITRTNARAYGASTDDRVQPRRLGHIVLGSPDAETSTRFFNEGIGFKISDRAGVGAFMRCSTDHHNLLIMPAPIAYPHHTSWQVEDIDAIGRGAMAMLEDHPERHAWGLGRHYAGSNFFWYLKDPSGTFSEYYSDMDCIVDDALWKPGAFEGARSLYAWGPPPPPSFLAPEDLAALMTGAHQPG